MFRHQAIAVVVASALVGCSLFVSLGNLNDGNDSGASNNGDAAPSGDGSFLDGGPDANTDANVDSGAYFVVDTCVADSADVVNLTAAGPIDWAHYGGSSDTDVKNVSPHVIGLLQQSTTGGQNPYGGDPRVFSWTDGTSFPSIANTSNGQYDSNGPMMLAVDANPAPRVLTLYLGTFSVKTHLNILMTPGPVGSSQILESDPGTATQVRCAVHFASPVAAEIDMTYEIDEHLDAGGDYGNIAFMSATVAPE